MIAPPGRLAITALCVACGASLPGAGGGGGLPRGQPGPGVAARVDSAVRSVMRERDVPGVAIALLRGDSLVLARGYGAAEVERGTPVTERTVFQLGSTTKPFTAMAVLLLADAGRIDLDARAAAYLPWIRERYPEVTVRQLLAHTGGAHTDVRRANVDEIPMAEFRRRFLAAPPRSAPGTRWEYSNAGYTLLALIVEAVAGVSFGVFVESRIFRPLGMADSGYRVPRQQGESHARGYDWIDGAYRPAPHVFSGWGNSGIESSARDLARWGAALERGELLSPRSYRLMFGRPELRAGVPLSFAFRDDPDASYGLGWFLTRGRGVPVQTHGGAIAGFSSVVTRVPEHRMTIVVLSNAKDRGDLVGQADVVARAILDAVLPRAAKTGAATGAEAHSAAPRARGGRRASGGEARDSPAFTFRRPG